MPAARAGYAQLGAGELDGEHAADAGHVVDPDVAAVRLDGLPRDRQPEAEAAAVLARWTSGVNRSSTLPGGRPPHASATSIATPRGGGVRADGHRRPGGAELERVLNQVEDRGSQQPRIGG